MKRYVISMTENELKLFSDFLSQKEFEEKIDRGDHPKPFERSKSIEIHRLQQGPLREEREQEFKNFVDHYGNALNFVGNNYEDKSAINKLTKHQRMSKRFIEDKNPEYQELHKTGNKVIPANPSTWSEENVKHDADLAAKKASAHLRTTNILYNEGVLERSGYDKKYAAKGLERILGKRINGDEAEAIVNNRVALDEKYKTNPHDTDGIREVGTHLGRRWDDAKMVYGEALDGRSLGKDAALAAAGTAALVGGGIALKKHLKKKKQEKELAENKYKTSDKKKKK